MAQSSAKLYIHVLSYVPILNTSHAGRYMLGFVVHSSARQYILWFVTYCAAGPYKMEFEADQTIHATICDLLFSLIIHVGIVAYCSAGLYKLAWDLRPTGQYMLGFVAHWLAWQYNYCSAGLYMLGFQANQKYMLGFLAQCLPIWGLHKLWIMVYFKTEY